MKKIVLLSFIICLIAYNAYAGSPGFIGTVVSSDASIVYEINETAETNPGYDSTACGAAPCYTETGSPDPDTANAGLDAGIDMEGTECITLDHTEAVIFDITDSDEIYALFKWAYNDAIENNEIFFVVECGATDANYYVYTNGLWYVRVDNFTATSGVSNAVDTDFWIKIRYKRAETACIAIWDGEAWEPWACDAHTNDAQALSIKFANNQDDAAEDQYFDNVKVVITDSDPFTGDPSTY